MNVKLGLLGKDISHSLSPRFYKKKLGERLSEYKIFDFKNADLIPPLESIFSQVDGLSITAPYKKHFLEAVIMDPQIMKLNSINCIKKTNSGFEATNTDYLALVSIFDNLSQGKSINHYIILGAGSMSHITQLFFDSRSIKYDIFSRSTHPNLDSIDFKEMYGNRSNCLVINSCAREFKFKGNLSSSSIFWDYNYSMPEHKSHLSTQCQYVDGVSLLEGQAEHALSFWGIV